MIRLSLAAAALALVATTNPGAAQTWGYGYNSYGSFNSYSRPTYNSYSYSYDSGRRYGYSRYGYQRCTYRCY
jgi:hypothetical protein